MAQMPAVRGGSTITPHWQTGRRHRRKVIGHGRDRRCRSRAAGRTAMAGRARRELRARRRLSSSASKSSRSVSMNSCTNIGCMMSSRACGRIPRGRAAATGSRHPGRPLRPAVPGMMGTRCELRIWPAAHGAPPNRARRPCLNGEPSSAKLATPQAIGIAKPAAAAGGGRLPGEEVKTPGSYCPAASPARNLARAIPSAVKGSAASPAHASPPALRRWPRRTRRRHRAGRWLPMSVRRRG